MRVQTTHIQAMLRQALALAEGIDGTEMPTGAEDTMKVSITYPTSEVETGETTYALSLAEVVGRVEELTDHANAEMRNELSKARGWKEP